jgi:hypothetical protein
MMFSVARFALPLLSLSSFVHSFPTAETLVKVNASPEEIHNALLGIRDKRLLVSTGKPVNGLLSMPYRR